MGSSSTPSLWHISLVLLILPRTATDWKYENREVEKNSERTTQQWLHTNSDESFFLWIFHFHNHHRNMARYKWLQRLLLRHFVRHCVDLSCIADQVDTEIHRWKQNIFWWHSSRSMKWWWLETDRQRISEPIPLTGTFTINADIFRLYWKDWASNLRRIPKTSEHVFQQLYNHCYACTKNVTTKAASGRHLQVIRSRSIFRMQQSQITVLQLPSRGITIIADVFIPLMAATNNLSESVISIW